MSDAISIATKNTQLTAASRTSLRSTRTSGTAGTTSSRSRRGRASRVPSADWRTVARDAFAATFDVVGDWAYLYAIYHRDYDGDGEADEYSLGVTRFDYELVINVVLAFCILSTVFSVWTVMTSLGRKCGSKNSLCCNCTVPRLCLAAIVLEDLPQFVLTAYIDYTFSGGLTPAGMMNICSSLTALVNRSTARYDEIVEEDANADLGTVYEEMA